MAGETRPSEEIEIAAKFWYEPTRAPIDGDWPQLIKNQWLGTRLPVKSEDRIIPPKALLPPDPDLHTSIAVPGFVKVGVQEAISALRLDGKEPAANFWVKTSKSLRWPDDQVFFFQLDEGRLIDCETEELVEIAVRPIAETEFGPPEGQLDLDIK